MPDTLPPEAQRAIRRATERVAETGNGYTAWVVCLAAQFPPPGREPTQREIDRWFLPQER